MTHFLVLVSGTRNHDTLSQQIIPAACQLCFCLKFYHNRILMMHYTESRFFVLSYELKNTFVTSFHLSSLFTNKRAVLLSALTDQSQLSFPAGFRHKIEHAPTSAGFWHQKNLTPERMTD